VGFLKGGLKGSDKGGMVTDFRWLFNCYDYSDEIPRVASEDMRQNSPYGDTSVSHRLEFSWQRIVTEAGPRNDQVAAIKCVDRGVQRVVAQNVEGRRSAARGSFPAVGRAAGNSDPADPIAASPKKLG
jgi:hypothetical protein